MITQKQSSESFRGHKEIASQEKVKCLQTGKAVPTSSRLLTLAPEYDVPKGLIHVGGRLRRSTSLAEDVVHPIVLESKHPVTRLIIQ